MEIVHGTVIEQKYQVEEKLGEGSSSVVYKAIDLDLKKIVALKFLREELALLPSRRKRFLRESRIAARFVHPSALSVRAIGEWQTTLYLVMDFHPGKTLRTILKEQQLPLDKVASLSYQMLSCLSDAHKNGLVHGDIKPANIMIKEENSELKLSIVDFGLASSTEEPTSSNKAAGTPNYMAPEVLLGASPTPASDLYSAALCIYEMITGILPFRRNDNDNTILYTVFHNDPKPPSTYRRVPKLIDKILAKALSLEAINRYATAQDFLFSLEEAWKSRYRLSSMQSIFIVLLFLLPIFGIWQFSRMQYQKYRESIFSTALQMLKEQKFSACRQYIPEELEYTHTAQEIIWQSIWAEFVFLLTQPEYKIDNFWKDPIWSSPKYATIQKYLKYYYIRHKIGLDCEKKEYQSAWNRCLKFKGTPGETYIIQNIRQRLEALKK